MDIHHVQNVVSLIIMSVLSGQDIREKEIKAVVVWPFLIAGIAIALTSDSFFNIVLSAIPGILLILLGKLSYEQIGLGDGITVLALGIWLGYSKIMLIIMIGTIVCGVFSVFYLLIKRSRQCLKTQVAFIPFLLLGLVVSLGIG